MQDSLGGWHQVPLGTTSRRAGEDLERLLRRLREELAFDVLDRVASRELAPTRLWAVWVRSGGSLPRLRAGLAERELTELIDPFGAFLRGKVAEDTAAHYLAAVRDLVGDGCTDGELTAGALQQWVDAQRGAPATARKHGVAARRFVQYCRRVHGAFPVDPSLELELPPPGPPRLRFLETSELRDHLVPALPEEHRALGAYLAGSGVDLSTALALRARDVDRRHREVRAPGTKTWNRDRVVRVAEWAWAWLEAALEGVLPNGRVFPSVRDRWVAQRAHRATCEALVRLGQTNFGGYTIRDHRHSWAVRAARAGWPIELIARQLGHKDGVLVLRVYGRFLPTREERDRWERAAAQSER